MRPSKTIKSAKKKADKVFSEYVRRSASNRNGNCICVSCGKRKHWKELHAGHWHSRRFLATRWDERNVHPQCPYCNTFIEGNKPGYSKYMTEKYSTEVLEELSKLAHSSISLKPCDIDEITEYYINKLKGLK
jgi:hypothetical protein